MHACTDKAHINKKVEKKFPYMSEHSVLAELFTTAAWGPCFSKLQKTPLFLVFFCSLEFLLPAIQCAPSDLSLWADTWRSDRTTVTHSWLSLVPRLHTEVTKVPFMTLHLRNCDFSNKIIQNYNLISNCLGRFNKNMVQYSLSSWKFYFNVYILKIFPKYNWSLYIYL